MKLDWRFWIFILVYVLTQAVFCISLNMRIDSEFQEVVTSLSNQIACTMGETELCPEVK
jgi:hypothetical protein